MNVDKHVLEPLRPVERRYLIAIAIAAGAFRLLFAFRVDAFLAARPYSEDSFYLFSCARQIALGHGFSIDGVHPTNGVQPLITLLYAPLFLITSDRWDAIRLSFLLTAALVTISAYLIGKLVARLRKTETRDNAPCIAAAIWAFSFPAFVQNTNGLETCLTITLILLALLQWRRILLNRTFSGIVIFGVTLGVLVLARIDSVFFVALFAMLDLWKRRSHAIRDVLLYCGISLLLSLPWWAYNVAVFHSLMPTSGQIGSLARSYSDNLFFLANALIDDLSIFYYHFPGSLSLAVTMLLLTELLVVGVLMLRLPEVRSTIAAYDLRSLLPLFLFSVALLLYYVFLFGAPHMLDRYLTALKVLIIILAAIVSAPVLRICWHSRYARSIRWSFALLSLIIVGFTVLHYCGEFLSLPSWKDYYTVGKWAASQHVPIGMRQTGTSGFMAENIVNLDGKVNARALEAQREGTVGEYVRECGFKYLVDWPSEIDPVVESARRIGLQFDSVGSIGYMVIYERRD